MATLINLHAAKHSSDDDAPGAARRAVSKLEPALEPDARLVGLDLSNRDLSGLDLSGADLSLSNLSGADLRGSVLRGAILVEADLSGAELLSVDLADADLSRAKAHRAGLGHARLERATLFEAELSEATLSNAALTDADLRHAKLCGARLCEADLKGASLDGADLGGADLDGAHVSGARLDDAILSGTRLRRLEGFEHASFLRAEIHQVDFSGAYLLRRHIIDQNYLDEFEARFPWLYKVWSVSSDCGRSLLRWTLWTLGLALVFGVAYSVLPINFGDNPTWLSPFYFSVVTLTTLGYGDVLPTTALSQAVVMVQVVLGYVMLGGLLSIFANKMARRGE